jgi:hypothetical protein
MATDLPINTGNRTLDTLRRMAAEKRQTKRELRKAFKTDPEWQRVIAELKERHAAEKARVI